MVVTLWDHKYTKGNSLKADINKVLPYKTENE